jgi:hypothetical protein
MRYFKKSLQGILSKLVVAFILVAGVMGCSDDDSTDNEIVTTGTVGGMIVDAASREGLVDVSVTLMAGGIVFDPVTTGPTGLFSFENVPKGEVLVTIDPPPESSYGETWIHKEFTNEHNTVTIGPIGLVAGDDSFSVRVLNLFGEPVGNYSIVLEHFVEYIDFNSENSTPMGSVLLDATTSVDGNATFTHVPNFFTLSGEISDTVIVYLPTLDIDGDGIFEFPGGERIFSLRNLQDPVIEIILDGNYETELNVLNSTIGNMTGVISTNPLPALISTSDTIYVSFNLPIQETVEVVISDEFGNPVSQTPILTVNGNNLSIDFSNDALHEGNEYNILIHAVSSIGKQLVTGDFYAPFFTPGSSDEVTITNITRSPIAPYRVDIEFSEPIGSGNSGGTTLSGENCVMFFDDNLADQVSPNTVGDVAGELGNPSCNSSGLNFIMNEPNPTGLGVKSGYSKHWTFNAPVDFTTTLPVTNLHLIFSKITTSNYVIKRSDGTRVVDFTGSTSIVIP